MTQFTQGVLELRRFQDARPEKRFNRRVFAVRAPHAFDGERFLPGGATVLVDEGRIVGVESRDYPVPDGVEVIDHPGATLLPGLVDSHTHLVGDGELGALDRVGGYTDDEIDAVMSRGLQRQLAAGVTTVRDLGDRRFCALERRDAQRSHPSSPGTLEPTILASGPPITSVRGHCWSMGGEVADTDGLRRAVAERAERAVDVVKIMASGGMNTLGTDVLGTQFTDADLRVAVEEAHAAGLPITAHAHSLVAVEAAIGAGVDGIEHCSCLASDGPRLAPELAARLAAAGITVCPTLGFDEAAYALLTPPPQMQEMLTRLGLDAASLRAFRLAACHAAYTAGVRLVAGVDSGIGAIKPHGYVAHAVATMVEAGMPCSAALASATASAADALGIGSTTGRLAAGRPADLLVVDGTVATDVTRLAEVRLVVVRGQRVPSPTLGG